MTLDYVADIKDGKLLIRGRKQFDADIRSVDWKTVTISIEKYIRKRSLRQNNFYWSGFIQSQIDYFKETTGQIFSKKEIHAFNKREFFIKEIPNIHTGEIIIMPRRTSSYTTIEFEEALETIRQKFLIAYNWVIPLPKEQLGLFNNKDIKLL